MFIRDHLAVVSHWAQDQLDRGVESRERGMRLLQLIEAAEALRDELHRPAQADTAPTHQHTAH